MLLLTEDGEATMAKLDKAAHAKAMKRHQKMMLEDPEYRKAWDNMVIQLFSDLADAKLPDDHEQR